MVQKPSTVQISTINKPLGIKFHTTNIYCIYIALLTLNGLWFQKFVISKPFKCHRKWRRLYPLQKYTVRYRLTNSDLLHQQHKN